MGKRGVVFSIISLFIFILILSNVSALQINPTSLNVSKSKGIDKQVNIEVTNNHNFTFYNVSLESSILDMEEISDLSPGETINTTFTITTDDFFEGEIRLTGLYESNLGIQNETTEVTIEYPEGQDLCNLNLVEGDSIKWINNVLDSIILRNVDTGEDITQISEGQNHTKLFPSPTVLNYKVLRWGSDFGKTCKIEVQTSEGFTHRSDYDAILDLDLNIIYKPTNIRLQFLETSFTTDFNVQKESIFVIENIGSNDAKNIHLIESDWIGYGENNFDLSPGETKTISFQITPIITNTSETNQTHERTIRAEGNFEPQEQDISIFINYAEITDDYSEDEVNDEVIKYLISKYCEDNPDDYEICGKKIVYSNNQSSEFNISMKEEQLDGITDRWFVFYDEYKKDRNNEKEKDDKRDNQIDALSQNFTEFKEDVEESNRIQMFLIIFIPFVLISGICVFILWNDWTRNKVMKGLNLFKGEKL